MEGEGGNGERRRERERKRREGLREHEVDGNKKLVICRVGKYIGALEGGGGEVWGREEVEMLQAVESVSCCIVSYCGITMGGHIAGQQHVYTVFFHLAQNDSNLDIFD